MMTMGTTETERAAHDTRLAADGALLFLLHSLLRSHWPLAVSTSANGSDDDSRQQQSSLLEPHAFAGNVGLLAAVVYDVPHGIGEPKDTGPTASHVCVRAIRVQHKLFVHFVSSRATLRLDLVVSEYVRAARTEVDAAVPSALASSGSIPRVVRVGDWVCQYELLCWRLERSVLDAFASGAAAPRAAMAAELAQLSEPLLTRVCTFLPARDFVRATQTSKSMRQLDENQALWHTFLQRDFPPGNANDARASYMELSKHRRSVLRDYANYVRRDRLERLEREQRRRGFEPRMPPLFLPPSPVDLWSAVSDGRLQDRYRHLDDDDDLRLPFDV